MKTDDSPVDTCLVTPVSRRYETREGVYIPPRHSRSRSVVDIDEYRASPLPSWPWFFLCQERKQPYRTYRVVVFARNEAIARALLPESAVNPLVRCVVIGRVEFLDVPVTHVITPVGNGGPLDCKRDRRTG